MTLCPRILRIRRSILSTAMTALRDIKEIVADFETTMNSDRRVLFSFLVQRAHRIGVFPSDKRLASRR